jgi:hypothetical protein
MRIHSPGDQQKKKERKESASWKIVIFLPPIIL